MKLKSILQILSLSAVWGISFLMMRIALPDYPPLWIALMRCALGAALMWSVLLLGGMKLPPRRLLPWLLIVALLNNAVPFSLIAWGERWVPSNVASVLNATVPIWTLVLSVTIDRKVPRLLTAFGVVLAFLGVVIVVVTHAPEPRAYPGGGGLMGGTVAFTATQVVAVTYLLPIWGVFWGWIAGESVGVSTYVGPWPAIMAHRRVHTTYGYATM